MKRIAFTAYPRIQALDVTGPWEVFDYANQLCDQPRYELVLASPDGQPVRSDSGLSLHASCSWDQLTDVHTLMVPGGNGVYATIANPEWMSAITPVAACATRVASVCTGAFVLAELGALDGRRAVTHWSAADRLRKRYPLVAVDDDQLYRVDGVWSSAGVSAGMDMALAMIERDESSALAHEISRWLVLFLRRHSSTPQLGPALQAQAVQSRDIARAQAYIANHPETDLRVEALADRMNMSPRNFTRAFTREVGVPPGRYVLQVRLEVAVRLLQTTDRAIDDIALACGIGSREALRRRLRDALGLTPTELRDRAS